MTLIELLCAYREIVKNEGREKANKFLEQSGIPALPVGMGGAIQKSVSDTGDFIDYEGLPFNPY